MGILFSGCVGEKEKEPTLEEAIKFCQENYQGEIIEKKPNVALTYHYCALPDGVDCEVKTLYMGLCLNYPGKETI